MKTSLYSCEGYSLTAATRRTSASHALRDHSSRLIPTGSMISTSPGDVRTSDAARSSWRMRATTARTDPTPLARSRWLTGARGSTPQGNRGRPRETVRPVTTTRSGRCRMSVETARRDANQPFSFTALVDERASFDGRASELRAEVVRQPAVLDGLHQIVNRIEMRLLQRSQVGQQLRRRVSQP